MAIWPGAAAASELADNMLANPGAEAGLSGWQGSGFTATPYSSAAVAQYPAPFGNGPQQGGSQLFTANGSGVISQVVDFSPRATTIDGGSQYVALGGLFGGRGDQPGGVRLVVQPLDQASLPLGQPLIVGPPSLRDRRSTTTLMACDMLSTIAPVGMRSVLVRLEAHDHGLADDLYLLPTRVSVSAGASYPPPRTTDGSGCSTFEPAFTPPPTSQPLSTPRRLPKIASLVLMPATNRCHRRAPLRFRIHPRWRSKVTSFEVTARGKHLRRGPSQTVRLDAPRGTVLHVTLRVTMRDARITTATKRYLSCH